MKRETIAQCLRQFAWQMRNEREQERFLRHWTSAQPAAAQGVLQETAMVLFRRFSECDESRPFLARFQVMGARRGVLRDLLTFDQELLERFTELWAETAPQATDREVALQTCLGRLAARAKLRPSSLERLYADEVRLSLQTQPVLPIRTVRR
ncbi:MAG: hypothetical protein DVB23_000452 [Verrucomicrobia bacterium]|nr:MAG: hypothetical protein DVB23_000452 [Verrucomicrobiota bacterium]